MSRLKSLLVLLATAGVLQALNAPAFACAACFGQSDSNMARGMNFGIFALLLVITSVLCGIAGFFVYVARRSTQLEHPTAHLADTLSEPQTNA